MVSLWSLCLYGIMLLELLRNVLMSFATNVSMLSVTDSFTGSQFTTSLTLTFQAANLVYILKPYSAEKQKTSIFLFPVDLTETLPLRTIHSPLSWQVYPFSPWTSFSVKIDWATREESASWLHMAEYGHCLNLHYVTSFL